MALRIEASPAKRAPLTRERVLHAAVQLADREGIEAVSMRRLGQELGVEAMSLYNHVANKDDLLDGMVDVVVGEIEPAPLDGAWKQVARGRILSARRTMLRHQWASAVIVSRNQPSPTVMKYMDSMGGIFRRAGFSVDLMHHAFHAMGSRVLGFSQELYDDSGDMADSPEIQALMLSQLRQEYPYITEIVEKITHDDASVVGAGCDDQWEFEFALDLILDGLDRLLDKSEGS